MPRASIRERYAREWLAGMFAAGYVDHDEGRFSLPAEHEPTLVQEPRSSGVSIRSCWV